MAFVSPGLTAMKIGLDDFISDLPQTNGALRFCHSQESAGKFAVPGSPVGRAGVASQGAVAALLVGHQLGEAGDSVCECKNQNGP